MPRGSRPSTRIGDAVVTCEISEIAAVVPQLRSQCQPCQTENIRHDDLYCSVTKAQTNILGDFLKHFDLRGRAEQSLSTSLRVRVVRKTLDCHTGLLETLKHIAAAADALRHLSPALVDRATKELRDVLSATTCSPSPSPLRCSSHDQFSQDATSTPTTPSPRSLRSSSHGQPSLAVDSPMVQRDLLNEYGCSHFVLFPDDEDDKKKAELTCCDSNTQTDGYQKSDVGCQCLALPRARRCRVNGRATQTSSDVADAATEMDYDLLLANATFEASVLQPSLNEAQAIGVHDIEQPSEQGGCDFLCWLESWKAHFSANIPTVYIFKEELARTQLATDIWIDINLMKETYGIDDSETDEG